MLALVIIGAVLLVAAGFAAQGVLHVKRHSPVAGFFVGWAFYEAAAVLLLLGT